MFIIHFTPEPAKSCPHSQEKVSFLGDQYNWRRKQRFWDNKHCPPKGPTTVQHSEIFQKDDCQKQWHNKIVSFMPILSYSTSAYHWWTISRKLLQIYLTISGENGIFFICLPFPSFFSISFEQHNGQSTPGKYSLFSFLICAHCRWTCG